MTGSKVSWVLPALFAAWCLGLMARNAWTPDEPRELALAASQLRAFTALPSLGDHPFTEKPPLAYWLSGAAMRVFGVSGPAARAPLLLYAALAFAAIFLLGGRLGTGATGAIAALVFATSALVFNTQVWLASDALLLAAVSLSLLGIYMAFGGEVRSRDFLAGCTCMHLGLLLSLFSKSLAGWLVPVSTLVTYLFFERRLRTLLQPAAWLPLLGSLLLFLQWVRSVAAGVDGHDHVRALFWDNLVGRFASYADGSEAVRALGHPSWPGKYLAELPLYLLPWTPLLVAAFTRLWRDQRVRIGASRATRFALCACVPALTIISLASTSRGVYAAPLIPGLALLVAVVLTAPDPDARMQSFIRGSLRWTAILLIALDGTLLVVAALGTLRGRDEFWGPLVSLMGMVCVVMLWARAVRGESIEGVVIRLAGAHVVALVAISMALFPLLDRAQDLERMARFIEAASGDRPLVLWLPDETTLAMSDLYLPRPACSILSASADHAQQLATCLQQHPRSAVVALADCPEEECGSTLDLTRRSDPMQRRRLELRDATLSAAGVVAADALVRPGGRAYVVGVTAP